jgi:surface protein
VLSDDNTVLTFYYDDKKKERGGMDVGPFTITQNSVNSGWYSQNKKITRVVFDKSFADCKNITSTAYWFYHCYNITTIEGLENLNTFQVTDMSYMFFNCHSLTSLDLSNFNTASVTNMSDMFWQCSQLTTLDVSSFNTSKVTDMEDMFNGCSNLTTILCNNTWSCENSWNMFLACSLLKGAISYDEEKTDGTYANPVIGYFTAKVIETRCAKPVISMKDGKLILSCETEGVEFVAQVEPLNTTLIEGATISLPNLYRVTVYAKKEGLEDSEPATMDVEMNIGSKGDVDSDGVVDISDAVRIVNLLMGK